MSTPTFTVTQLAKTDGSLVRSPKLHKYQISCEGRITKTTPTSAPWLRVLKLLKLDISDIDKSRILLAELESHGTIVVKIGASKHMKHEYDSSIKVHTLKGFVKYICFFKCNDDFRSIPAPDRTSLCNGPGDAMGVILMPYYTLGSLANYKWIYANKEQLQSCLKHSFLTILTLFHKVKLIHGDLHPGNVLLKETKQANITYNIPEVGQYTIKTYGLRTWIMDYENMKHADFSSRYGIMQTYNDFYYDIQKFFMLLYNTIKTINPRTVSPIVEYISRYSIKGEPIHAKNVDSILEMIDGIELSERAEHPAGE